MEYDEAVIEFLSQKENLRLAMEVAERLEEVRRRLELRLWRTCHKLLADRLAGSEWADTWRAAIDSDEELTRNEYGVGLEPRGASDDVPRVFPYLTRYHYGSLNFYLRVPRPDAKETTDVQAANLLGLEEALKQEGFRSTKKDLAWKSIRTYDSLNSFLLDLSERVDELALEAVEFLWATFEGSVALFDRANAALRSLK